MKQFEVGKIYYLNDINNTCIMITKRTKKYVYFLGDHEGRKMIKSENMLNLGEHIIINGHFCFAEHELNRSRYNENMICGGVPAEIRQKTRFNMEVYSMSLHDAFNDAVRESDCSKMSELYKAWEKDDFRKYIPSAYITEYLDFDKYPLKYAI